MYANQSLIKRRRLIIHGPSKGKIDEILCVLLYHSVRAFYSLAKGF